jgi:peptidoglycan/LPS O-acetylase OafA/YrhL
MPEEQRQISSDRSLDHTESFYIPSLDGIRAFAFLLVFISHLYMKNALGGFGVTVFFFLSGYLIVTLLRREAERTGRISLKKFYARRFLRIFPPCYIVLAIVLLLYAIGIVRGACSLTGMLSEFLYFTNYYFVAGGNAIPSGTAVLWSLAIEEHFYLVFPLLYIGLRRLYPKPIQQVVLLSWLCVVILIWRLFLIIHFHATDLRATIATDTRFDSILFGCILALYGNPMMDRTRVPERVWKWILLPISIGVLSLTLIIKNDVLRETVDFTVQGIALFPVFIAAVRYPRWLVFRALNLRVVRFIGVLSYTLYLVHYTVISTVNHWSDSGSLVRAILSLTISLLVTIAIYYLVERPCARLRRHFRSRPVPESAAALPADLPSPAVAF